MNLKILSAMLVTIGASIVFTEWRVEKLRPYVVEQGIREGVSEAVRLYKKEYVAGEHLSLLKRKRRDAVLKTYGEKLNKILEMTDD